MAQFWNFSGGIIHRRPSKNLTSCCEQFFDLLTSSGGLWGSIIGYPTWSEKLTQAKFKCETRPVCRVLCTSGRPGVRIAMHFATCLEGCQSASQLASQQARQPYHLVLCHSHWSMYQKAKPASGSICPRPLFFAIGSRTIWCGLAGMEEDDLLSGSRTFSSFVSATASAANRCNSDTWRSGLSLPTRFVFTQYPQFQFNLPFFKCWRYYISRKISQKDPQKT